MTRAAAANGDSDPSAWVRDTLQARLVTQIFSQRVHDLVVKGGMAMRLLHDQSRATKDIDLDAGPDLPLATIQSVVRRAIKKATIEVPIDGLTVTEPKQTGTTARWKVSGTEPVSGMPIHVTIEVSHRDAIDPQDLAHVPVEHDDEEDRWAVVYNDQALAFKKVKALMSSSRQACRDVADLYLLIEGQVKPPTQAIKAWLAEAGEDPIGELWRKLEAMDETQYQSEVLPALPVHGQLRKKFEDWDQVRLVVGQHVEAWLRHCHLEGAQETASDQMHGSTPTHHGMH